MIKIIVKAKVLLSACIFFENSQSKKDNAAISQAEILLAKGVARKNK